MRYRTCTWRGQRGKACRPACACSVLPTERVQQFVHNEDANTCPQTEEIDAKDLHRAVFLETVLARHEYRAGRRPPQRHRRSRSAVSEPYFGGAQQSESEIDANPQARERAMQTGMNVRPRSSTRMRISPIRPPEEGHPIREASLLPSKIAVTKRTSALSEERFAREYGGCDPQTGQGTKRLGFLPVQGR